MTFMLILFWMFLSHQFQSVPAKNLSPAVYKVVVLGFPLILVTLTVSVSLVTIVWFHSEFQLKLLVLRNKILGFINLPTCCLFFSGVWVPFLPPTVQFLTNLELYRSLGLTVPLRHGYWHNQRSPIWAIDPWITIQQ